MDGTSPGDAGDALTLLRIKVALYEDVSPDELDVGAIALFAVL